MINEKNRMQLVTFMDTERLEKLEQAILNLERYVKELASSAVKKDAIYTLKQAAAVMGKGYTWIYSNKHKIGCSRVGGEWKIKQSSIDSFLGETFYKDK